MLRDANETIVNGVKIAFSDDWNFWWNVDWQLLTNKLKPFYNEITFVKRGKRESGPQKGRYAYGRVDRGDGMLIPHGETLIDAHCENNNIMHPDKLNKFISLFESIHGKL